MVMSDKRHQDFEFHSFAVLNNLYWLEYNYMFHIFLINTRSEFL